MKREVHVLSYFSLPTDLAAEMRDWPEFVGGVDYTADLRDHASGETVSVRLATVEDESPYIIVAGSGSGALFDRVLGRVIYALSAHSDNLMVDRTA